MPKAPPKRPVAEAVKAVSSPKGLVIANKQAQAKLPVFTQSLKGATKQNLETGGNLQKYRQSPAGQRYLKEHPAHHNLVSLHTLGKGASTVGNEINLLAQATNRESGAGARERLAQPAQKASEALQSPGTAHTVAAGLRSAGINVSQETLEKVTKSLGRLPEDVAYMPRGTVESLIKPKKGIEQFVDLAKEVAKDPAEHADFITLLGVPFLNKAARRTNIASGGEATGVGDVTVRPMARHENPLRMPSFGTQTEKNLPKRVVGGHVQAGRVDLHVGSQRQVEHLQHNVDERAMKEHTSKDKAVNEAIVPYGEGHIKPNDRVGSADKIIARLRERSKGLEGDLKLENARQIAVYEKIKNFTDKQHEEAIRLSEGQRAYQAPKSIQAGHEGVIKPHQLRARFMGIAISHGDELGRGPLRIRKGAVSPLIDTLREVNDKIKSARAEFGQASSVGNREIAGAKARVQRALGKREGRLLPTTIKPITGYHRTLAEARQALEDVRAKHEGERARERGQLADLEDHRKAIEAQIHESHGPAIKKLKMKNGRISTKKGSGVLHDHLVDANNEHVPWSEVEDLYYSHGHKNPPLYVSQTSRATSSGGPGKVRGISRYAKPRSGINVENGTYDTTLENLRRSNVRTGNEIAKVQGKRAYYRRFGKGEGTQEAIDKAVHEFNHDSANEEFIKQYGLMERVSRGPARFLRSPAGREEPNWLDAGIQAEIRNMQAGPGQFTMVPAKLNARLLAHEKVEALAREPWSSPLGAISKSMTAFRKAALILNPHWWGGVPLEYMIRGLMGNRLGMKKLGGEYMDRWREIMADPSMPSHLRYEAAKNVASFDQGTTLGGWVGDLLESNNINDIMRPQQSKWGALMDRTPKGLRLWKGAQGGVAKWLHYIERTNNQKILGQIAHDQIKQTIKETHDLVDDMDALHKKWAEDKLKPNEGDDVVERLIRIAGNWHHLTPMLKQMRMYVLPFGMWTVNALSYMLKVMPRDYPGRSMLIVALSQGAPREDLPLYLQGTLPPVNILGHQVRFDPQYYLPTSLGREFGFEKGAPHVGLLEGTNPVLAALALAEGNPIKAAEKVAETVTPGVGQVKRAVEARQGVGFGVAKAISPVRFATPSKKEEEGGAKKKKGFGSKYGSGGFSGGFGGKF